ncbi:MAG: aspartyl beta-hydroxylase [Firmicutes bacterium]|nr:aspartyl beta-hydroxylase [Bacillota bacterium]
MSEINHAFKNLFLSSIGAMVLTAEKSKSLMEQLINKGEITIEQGKILNQELKRNIEWVISETSTTSGEHVTFEEILSEVEQLNTEDLKTLHDKLNKMITTNHS